METKNLFGSDKTSKVIPFNVGNYAGLKGSNRVGEIIKKKGSIITLGFGQGEDYYEEEFNESYLRHLTVYDIVRGSGLFFLGKVVIYKGDLYYVINQENRPDQSSVLELYRKGVKSRVEIITVDGVTPLIPGIILEREDGSLIKVVESGLDTVSFTEDIDSDDPLIETYTINGAIERLKTVKWSDGRLKRFNIDFYLGYAVIYDKENKEISNNCQKKSFGILLGLGAALVCAGVAAYKYLKNSKLTRA